MVAQTLEYLRKQAGLSRAAVASKLDLSERHVYRIERGLTPLKRLHALALAEVYGVDVETVERAALVTGGDQPFLVRAVA